MIKTKREMFILIGSFVLFIVLGTVSYAFFNYARIGVANEVSLQAETRMVESITTPEVSESLAIIPTCPGCVFTYKQEEIYTSWSSEIPTVLSYEDYTSDYEELVRNNKKFFLGMILDEANHTITRAFACGIYTDAITNTEKPFCIEGTENGEKSNANRMILQSANLWNNTCYGNLYCEDSNIEVNDSSDGYVSIGNEVFDCSVSTDGTMLCENH